MGGRRWGTDDNRLTLWWGHQNIRTIARKLERTPYAVYQRAVMLRLTERNRDAVSLCVLAEQFGVVPGTLKAVLDKAGVRPAHVPVDPRKAGKTFTALRYNPERAKKVFEANYLNTETASGYARRMGHDDGWMRRRLQQAGMWIGKRHRYPSSVLDKVCQEYVNRQGDNFKNGQHPP